MSYVDIFTEIPLKEIGITIVQTITVYWFILLGLKCAGRRLFAEKGPQDLVILLLIAEASNLGITHQDAGYWGAIAAVLTIILMGSLIERIQPLRDFLNDKKILIYKDGHLNRPLLKKYLLEEEDLEEMAREYGVENYNAFGSIYLEGRGDLTGVLKAFYKIKKDDSHPAS